MGELYWRYCPNCEAYYGFIAGTYATHCPSGHEFSLVANLSLFEHLTSIWHLFYANQGIPILPAQDISRIQQFLSQWRDVEQPEKPTD